MSITASVEIITPTIAQEYLKMNTNNYRKISNHRVSSYAEDMKRGLWRLNGEGIVFDENGILINGQHRLLAIIKSGVSVQMLVIRGVENGIATFDMPYTRTISQIMAANGMPLNSTALAAARIIISSFQHVAPKNLMEEYAKQHYDDLRDSISIASHGNTRALGQKASCCLAVYVTRRLHLVNDDILRDFFKIFNSGTFEPNQIRDPSPALVSSRYFLTKYSGFNGWKCTLEQYSIMIQALEDFAKNRNRKRAYATECPKATELLNTVREIDGLNTVKYM